MNDPEVTPEITPQTTTPVTPVAPPNPAPTPVAPAAPVAAPVPVATPIAPPTPAVGPVVPTKKSSTLKIIGIVVGALMLVIIIFIVLVTVLVGSTTAAPQKQSNLFIADLQAKDATSAYPLTTSSFQAATSQEQLQSIFDQVGPVLAGTPKVTSKEISTSTSTGKVAVFVYTIKDSSGKTYYAKTILKQDGSDWKVINFRSSATPLDTTVE
jgi:pyruvate dehydrogenase E2 component (dihydrolipoamide acetyltransferase)